MCTKQEWKEAAERRLTENLALRVLVTQMENALKKKRGQARIRELYRLVRIAKEVGR